MANEFKNKNEFKEEFQRRIIERYGRSFEQAHITEKYMILGEMVRDYASIHWNASKNVVSEKQEKQMYYFSMEFLMGRLLTNNLMNLGIYEIAKEGLAELGQDINELEDLVLSDNYFDLNGDSRTVEILRGKPEGLKLRRVWDIR